MMKVDPYIDGERTDYLVLNTTKVELDKLRFNVKDKF